MIFNFQLLLLELTQLRTGLTYFDIKSQSSYCHGLIVGFSHASALSYQEVKRLTCLLENCISHTEKPFPGPFNAGPQPPIWGL